MAVTATISGAFVVAIIMIALSLISGEALFAAIGCIVVGATSSCLLRFYPLDPRVWFSTLGGLYSYAYSLQTVFGFRVGSYDGQASAIAALFFVSALIAMWFVAVIVKVPEEFRREELPKRMMHLVALPLAGLVAIYLMLDASLVQAAGVQSKRELWDMDIGLPLVGFLSNLFLMLGAWLMAVVTERRKGALVALVVGLVVLYIWAGTGERDVVFKWVLIVTFLYVFKGWISTRAVVIAGALVILTAPVMKDLGVIMGNEAVDFRRTQQLHAHLLDGEWAAAGSNLEIIMRDPGLYEGLGGERFLDDLRRGSIPGALFRGMNTSSWYIQDYTPYVTGRDTAGIGFSLSGAWWIYGGILGVIVGGVVYGGVSWCFYRLGSRGALYLAGYCLYVPLALWAMRGDLSFWVSSISKQVLLPTFVLLLSVLFLTAVGRARRGLQGGMARSGETRG